ncbi:MAG: hypothetical protein U0667_06850 [Chloroflexota bacterium]
MSDEGATAAPGGASSAASAAPVGESRWPMALAVVAVMVLSLFQSTDISVLPTWLPPLVLEGGFLAYLIWADPGRIDRQTPRIRAVSIMLVVGLILLSALSATVLLAIKLTQATTLTPRARPSRSCGTRPASGSRSTSPSRCSTGSSTRVVR